MIDVTLERIRNLAQSDVSFKDAIIKTAKEKPSIVDFCKVCREAGIEIYPMDIADLDESFYAAMKRSTNGGGENSPHLNWEDEVFMEFINSL